MRMVGVALQYCHAPICRYRVLVRVLAQEAVVALGMRYVVAHSMIDLGLMDVDGDDGLDSPFPNNVINPERVEITAQLRQCDCLSNSGSRGPLAHYGRRTIQAEIKS